MAISISLIVSFQAPRLLKSQYLCFPSVKSVVRKGEGKRRFGYLFHFYKIPAVLTLIVFARQNLKNRLCFIWVRNAIYCSAVRGCSCFFFAARSLAFCSVKRWMKSAQYILYPYMAQRTVATALLLPLCPRTGAIFDGRKRDGRQRYDERGDGAVGSYRKSPGPREGGSGYEGLHLWLVDSWGQNRCWGGSQDPGFRSSFKIESKASRMDTAQPSNPSREKVVQCGRGCQWGAQPSTKYLGGTSLSLSRPLKTAAHAGQIRRPQQRFLGLCCKNIIIKRPNDKLDFKKFKPFIII